MEKFAQDGTSRADDRVSFGTQEVVSLSLGPDLSAAKAIDAILALRRRHVPTAQAKKAVEAAISGEDVVLVAPMVEDMAKFAEEIKESGFCVDRNTPDICLASPSLR